MRATLPAENTFNGKNLNGEKLITMAITIVDCKTKKEPVRVYVWHAPSKGANYASVWAYGNNRSFAGHGRATGGGYNRPSAALAAAFDSAGVTLDSNIAGVGERAMIDACLALAVALGSKAKDLHAVVIGI